MAQQSHSSYVVQYLFYDTLSARCQRGPLHCASSRARYTSKRMTEALKQAIDELSTLPPSAQERIGEQLLTHVEKIRALRSQLDTAATSLDRGGGREITIDDVIKRARARYGRA